MNNPIKTIQRGDIYIVLNNKTSTGHEQDKTRPAIIVSNEYCNKHSGVVEVVYLTTAKKKIVLPTHVPIFVEGHESIALCEAIYSVDKSRLYKCMGMVNSKTMKEIDSSLMISIGLAPFSIPVLQNPCIA